MSYEVKVIFGNHPVYRPAECSCKAVLAAAGSKREIVCCHVLAVVEFSVAYLEIVVVAVKCIRDLLDRSAALKNRIHAHTSLKINLARAARHMFAVEIPFIIAPYRLKH